MKEVIKVKWKTLCEEINVFCETTTIHGFSYLSVSKKVATRFIWSLLLLSSLSVATLMISNTFVDLNRNPLSTNVDTIDIKNVPFPAVTFYPGHYRSEKTLLRRMYDYTEFERYHADDSLTNNSDFLFNWSPFLTQSWFSNLLNKSMNAIATNDLKKQTECQHIKKGRCQKYITHPTLLSYLTPSPN